MTGNPQDDQLRAAEGEAEMLMHRIAAHNPDSRMEKLPYGEISNAWREGLLQHLTERTIRFCRHGLSPGLIIYGVWLPGLLLCPDCHKSIQDEMGIGEREDNTCDGCGQYRPGEIHSLSLQLGAVVMIGGLCPPCMALERRTAEAARDT